MRMRTIAAAAALGMLLAGCTPVSRAVDGPVVIPQGIAWRYAEFCLQPAGDGLWVASLSWSNAGADIELEAATNLDVDIAALEAEIEECLTAYRYQEWVSPAATMFERVELYEYYSGVTLPCLAAHGVDIEPVSRQYFLEPDGGEPWNPYLGMDLPFDRLLELYQACPPRPAYLDSPRTAG
jgi:hypothetical protein